MKKLINVTILVLSIFLLVGCTNETDATKFKNEYESLNGEVGSNGKAMREIKISEDNPFVYISEEDLINKIDNDETFLVYFGYSSCPWCRSVLPTLISALKDNNINKIYYANLYEIRDTLKLVDGEVVVDKEGTKEYKEILKRLDNVLDEYTLNDGEESVSTGEKRIYAPSVISVVKGESTKLTLGISELQTDAYMDLTSEIIEDTYNLFEDVIKEVSNNDVCDIGGKC